MKPGSTDAARELLRRARVVHTAAAVNAAVTRLAGEIHRELHDANPMVVCVMRGALVFAGQLLPQLAFPLELDVMDATRYGDATRGSVLSLRAMPAADVAGRTVLLVDDILDEGITLSALRASLLERGALRVLTAVFAVKQTDRARPLDADFFGMTVPDVYVFGFGMDVHGYWRNLPAVYALQDE
jgi:hypoxanthine phosphoribosyltransferase